MFLEDAFGAAFPVLKSKQGYDNTISGGGHKLGRKCGANQLRELVRAKGQVLLDLDYVETVATPLAWIGNT